MTEVFAFFESRSFTVLLVFMGMVCLAGAGWLCRQTLVLVPARSLIKWRILSALVLFFLLGYLAFIAIRLSGIELGLELLTAVVFFAGGLFVYGVIELARETIIELNELNEQLEKRVENRTAELLEVNSQLKISQGEFRRQSSFIKSALDALSHPFYVIDVATHEVILYNEASRFAGKSYRHCYQLTHASPVPCSGQDHPCPIQEIRRTGKPVVLDHVHYDDHGQLMFVEVHGYPVYAEDGTLLHIIEYVLDVTDRRKAENALVQAIREAKKASRYKSEFLANMSHEIRTPMNAILGMTKLTLQTNLTREQRDYLETVESSSELLLTLINDILDFSKIEAGKMELQKRTFVLGHALNPVIDLLSREAEKKGLMLSLQIERGTEEGIFYGDDLRLRQILFNLLGNAIKFTEQGRIEVSCRWQLLAPGNGELEFVVRDTGVGIPEAEQEEIFQSFSQAESGRNRSHGGTGLGLAICRKLVDLMQGRISLSSSPGLGSTFNVVVCLQPGKAEDLPVSQEETAAPDLMPLDLLVVDDIATNRDLARLMLEQAGHQVTVAATGLSALEFLAAHEYDAVLLDVQMPVMDGFATVAIIRQCERGEFAALPSDENRALYSRLADKRAGGKHLPVIALTAHALTEDREVCLAAGMDGYLSKPFQVQEMFRQLARVCPEKAI